MDLGTLFIIVTTGFVAMGVFIWRLHDELKLIRAELTTIRNELRSIRARLDQN